MKSKILIILALCTIFFTSMVNAQSAQWQEPTADFTQIQTIYLDPNIQQEEKVFIPPLDLLAIKENLQKQSKTVKNFKIVATPDQADAIIKVELLANKVNRYTVPASKETVYEKITITDKDGKQSTISVPRTKVNPAYTIFSNYFSVRFILTNQEGQKLYEYIDSREGQRYFGNMFRRATKDFYRNLNKLK